MKIFSKWLEKRTITEALDPAAQKQIDEMKTNIIKFYSISLQDLQDITGEFGIAGFEEAHDMRGLPGLIENIYGIYKGEPEEMPSAGKFAKQKYVNKIEQFLNNISTYNL